MCKVFNVLFSVKKICLVFIAAIICFGCSRSSGGIPVNVIEDNSIASIPNPADDSESIPIDDIKDSSTASTPEPLPVIERGFIYTGSGSIYTENGSFYPVDNIFGQELLSYLDGKLTFQKPVNVTLWEESQRFVDGRDYANYWRSFGGC